VYVYFPFRSQSHEVEPVHPHFFVVELHTKPAQHDLPKNPPHFLPPLAQLKSLNLQISKIHMLS
jgi:hypothetical protein